MAVMGLATLGILGVGSLGVNATSSGDSGGDGLASRLATKFGLSKADVSREIESYHTEEHQKHDAEMKDKLSSALQKKVDDGTITADQKTAIEVKLEERHKARQAEREANRSSGTKPTKDEMKAKIGAERVEMDTWLKDQGIDLDLKDVLPAHEAGRPDKMSKEGGDIRE